jgi:hypothetical protein
MVWPRNIDSRSWESLTFQFSNVSISILIQILHITVFFWKMIIFLIPTLDMFTSPLNYIKEWIKDEYNFRFHIFLVKTNWHSICIFWSIHQQSRLNDKQYITNRFPSNYFTYIAILYYNMCTSSKLTLDFLTIIFLLR